MYRPWKHVDQDWIRKANNIGEHEHHIEKTIYKKRYFIQPTEKVQLNNERWQADKREGLCPGC